MFSCSQFVSNGKKIIMNFLGFYVELYASCKVLWGWDSGGCIIGESLSEMISVGSTRHYSLSNELVINVVAVSSSPAYAVSPGDCPALAHVRDEPKIFLSTT